MSTISDFCKMIRARSKENSIAMSKLVGIHGPAISILRQELDSMVRVIFLLKQSIPERKRLIELTLKGEKWTALSKKGKYTPVTDKELVDISNDLQGWTAYVYKFGCSFIHLSNFHNYHTKDPFSSLSLADKNNISVYMRNYHGRPQNDEITMSSLVPYLAMIFEKISSNLECYVVQLSKGGKI